MSSSNSLTYGAVLPSFHRKFLPAIEYSLQHFSSLYISFGRINYTARVT